MKIYPGDLNFVLKKKSNKEKTVIYSLKKTSNELIWYIRFTYKRHCVKQKTCVALLNQLVISSAMSRVNVMHLSIATCGTR